jgi:hypothetical protein
VKELRLDYSAKTCVHHVCRNISRTLDSFNCNQFFVIAIKNPKDGKFYLSYSSSSISHSLRSWFATITASQDARSLTLPAFPCEYCYASRATSTAPWVDWQVAQVIEEIADWLMSPKHQTSKHKLRTETSISTTSSEISGVSYSPILQTSLRCAPRSSALSQS